MTVNRPWTYSPTTSFQHRTGFRRTTSSGPFYRVPEADSEFAPGYSWPPHLYQENPSVEDAAEPVNGAELSYKVMHLRGTDCEATRSSPVNAASAGRRFRASSAEIRATSGLLFSMEMCARTRYFTQASKPSGSARYSLTA